MVKIAGLQKTTLLDYPGKVAATVFLGGCNFRCPYCHNASLVLGSQQPPSVTEDSFFKFLRTRKGMLDGVCITGGEPLLSDSLAPFLTQIKELGFLIKLDTNGSFPQKLKSLVSAGLVDMVAMDIKNAPASYPQTIGTSASVLPQVEESLQYLLHGCVAYELRTTLVRSLHTAEDIRAIGQWVQGAQQYFLQNFVDSGDILTPNLSGFSPAEMQSFLHILQEYVPTATIRGT